MPAKKEKRDLQADHRATVIVPQGHWDAFVIHCQRAGVTRKAAVTAMIEAYVDRKYLALAYDDNFLP